MKLNHLKSTLEGGISIPNRFKVAQFCQTPACEYETKVKEACSCLPEFFELCRRNLIHERAMTKMPEVVFQKHLKQEHSC